VDTRQFATALVFALSIVTGVCAAAGAGLTSAEREELHELGFAVVPSVIPAGFRIKHVSINREARSYRIEYVRAGGAVLTFAGQASAPAPPPKKRGFFGSLGKTIANIGHSASTTSDSLRSNSSEHVTPAQEQEMTSVASDSALTGPIHFENADGCLQGSPDSTKALITNAHFTVRGCHLTQPDPLIRAYRSVVRL
jgi:hypothetical protein